MKRIRLRVLLLGCWLFFYGGMELQVESTVATGVSLALGVVVMILTLAVPRVGHLPFWVVLLTPVSLLFAYRYSSGALADVKAIPIVWMELGGILVTFLLSAWVSAAIREFETAVAHITIGRQERMTEAAVDGQGAIYREVRRARNHQRPMAMLAVAVDENSIRPSLDRIVKEAQQTMARQYALGGVSRVLCDKLADSDIIVQGKDLFLVVLPEMTAENLPGLIERLRRQVADQVGVELKIGSAVLPADGYTFDGLIEKATRAMNIEDGAIPYQHWVRMPAEPTPAWQHPVKSGD